MRSSSAPARRPGRRRPLAAAAAALALAFAGLTTLPASAAGPTLTITPTTWNIVGLDSNKPAVSNGNPNEFPVGVKVCNTGDATATSVQTSFAWTTTNSNLALSNPSSTTRTLGSLAPGSCALATYNVEVNRNQQSFTNRTRGYQITATASGGLSVSTPSNRELYVEKLVSQSRNAVLSISSAACTGGTCTVYRGQTYTFTLTSKTATQGYEQLESFVNFPDGIFEIKDIKTTYAAPAGARNDKVYADACGWDARTDSATYRSCIGPTNFSGGKAGGNPIKTVYTVKIVGTGSGTLSGLVYDFSGSSFHYNADFGTGANAVPFSAIDAADLSITKSHTGAFVRGGTGTYRLTVTNAGPSTSGNVTVVDTLPAGLTYRSISGTGWSCSGCSAASQTVTLTRAGLASGTSSFVGLTVDVALSAASVSTNRATVSQATSSTLNDPVQTNNATTDPTTVADPDDADLVLTKTRDDVFDPGEDETYVLRVRNDGPDLVAGPITLTDTLPAGMTFVSAIGAGWNCSATGQVVTCSRTSGLASMEAAPDITMVVAIDEDAPPRMTNTTSVTGAIDNDPNHSNNVEVTDEALAGEADLWLEKTHTGSFPRGGSAGYKLTVGNDGPDAAVTPRVVDTLPSGLTFASHSGSGWTCANSGQIVTCDSSGALEADETSAPLIINVNVASGAPALVTNAATVCSVMTPAAVTGCPDQKQGTSEVDFEDNSTEDVTATVAPTDLSLSKSSSASSVNTNTNFTYTLRVTNNGPNPATGVTIVDEMPVYIDPGSITTNPGTSNTQTPPYCDVSDREVTCDVGTVSATAGSNTATVTITARALASASGRTLVNNASTFSNLGDTNSGNDTASTSVTVNGTLNNAAPTAAAKTATVAHGDAEGVDVTLSGSDADGDPLTFNLVGLDGGAQHGSVVISDNVATYVPDGDFTGTDTFQYRSNDGVTNSAPATVTVTVTNTPPMAQNASATVPHRDPAGVDVELGGSDGDGDSLTFSLVGSNGGAQHGTVTISGDTATYVPTGDHVGTDTFQYRANDGIANSSPATVTVTLTNSAPALGGASVAPSTVSTTGTLTATAVSPDDADDDDLSFTYTWRRIRGATTQTVETTTSSSQTDSIDLGSLVDPFQVGDEIEVTIVANDGHAESPARTDSATVTNTAPTAQSQSVSMSEDTATTVTLAGTDADDDPLVYRITDLPDHGDLYEGTGTGGTRITTVPFELSGVVVTYEPGPDFNGPDSFFFRTYDGAATSSPAEVTVLVAAINDAPVAQDTALTIGSADDDAEVALSSLVADDETPDQSLTYEIVTPPTHGTAQLDGNVVTYLNDGDRSGDQFTYRVTDRGDPDGCILVFPLPPDCDGAESATATVTIDFDNNAPDADSQAVTTAEDTDETITLTGSDPDDDNLTFSITTLPQHGDLYAGGDTTGAPIASTPFVLPGALVTYEPDPDYNGPDSFTFTASDGGVDSETATVDVDVTPVNDRPVAQDGTITIPHDQNSGNVDLADLASDVETADADLTYEIVSQGTRGEATLSGSKLTYSRTGSGHASDRVTYRVTDRGDPDDCGTPVAGECAAPRDSFVAQIDVDFENSVPSADPQSVATDEDTAKTVTLSGSDFHGDDLTYVVTSLPAHGTLHAAADASGPAIGATPYALSGTQVTYVPDAHYNGPDGFEFKASDGEVESSAARVSITVRPVNDAPNANDGTMTVPADDDTAQLDLAALAHDRETADLDLVYVVVDDPDDGTATVSGSIVTYTRTSPGWNDDTFTFMVTDRGDPDDCGAPAPATCSAPRDSNFATITVEFAYEPPTADAQQVTTSEDTDADVALTGTSSGGRELSFRVVSLPQHGNLVDAATGDTLTTVPVALSRNDVRYEPDADYSGPDSFDFVTRDGVTESDVAVVDITVTPVNDTPVAEDGGVTIPNDATETLTLEGSDIDGDALTFEVLTPPSTGTLGDVGDPVCDAGTCTATVDYTPEPGHAGDLELVYAVDDGTASSETATISITVTDAGGGEEPSPTPAPAPSPSSSPSEPSAPTPTPGPTPTASSVPTPTESPSPSPAPDGSPTPRPSEAPTTGPSETPAPGPNPSQPPLPTPPLPEPTPGHRCGDPIEVTAIGEPIVATPCSELIIVHAEVLATIQALGGNDTIRIDGTARVHVIAGRGDDEVDCTTTPAEVMGGAGDDVIRCGVSPDVLRGGRGSDVLHGGYGDDEIFGGKGSDRLEGSEGDDVMIASLGADGLFGGPGIDVLKGQAGDDELRGGTDGDLLRGSGGDDTELGGEGDDVVRAGPGEDRLEGALGNDRLVGNEGIDHVRGGQGDDVLRGQNGADHLFGLKGDDVLKGAAGKNHLYGGWGHDTCVAPSRGNSWSSCERQLTYLF